MLGLDQPTATLVAAVVAAILSVLNLWSAERAGRRGEFRAQFRSLLKPYVSDLGEVLHEAIACATIAVKYGKKESASLWMDKAKGACERLKHLRVKVKYPLWGIDDGLRQFTRVASWLEHTKDQEQRQRRLLAAAESLRQVLDEAVRSAFLRGRPPRFLERRRVSVKAKDLRKLWDGDARIDEAALVDPGGSARL